MRQSEDFKIFLSGCKEFSEKNNIKIIDLENLYCLIITFLRVGDTSSYSKKLREKLLSLELTDLTKGYGKTRVRKTVDDERGVKAFGSEIVFSKEASEVLNLSELEANLTSSKELHASHILLAFTVYDSVFKTLLANAGFDYETVMKLLSKPTSSKKKTGCIPDPTANNDGFVNPFKKMLEGLGINFEDRR